ncbi:hypothetical protein [Peribacillus butanolivorans]
MDVIIHSAFFIFAKGILPHTDQANEVKYFDPHAGAEINYFVEILNLPNYQKYGIIIKVW